MLDPRARRNVLHAGRLAPGPLTRLLGLAPELKEALRTYTESGGTGKTALDQAEAISLMLAKHEVCCGLFHGFDWSVWNTGTPAARVGLLPAAQEQIRTALAMGADRGILVEHDGTLEPLAVAKILKAIVDKEGPAPRPVRPPRRSCRV